MVPAGFGVCWFWFLLVLVPAGFGVCWFWCLSAGFGVCFLSALSALAGPGFAPCVSRCVRPLCRTGHAADAPRPRSGAPSYLYGSPVLGARRKCAAPDWPGSDVEEDVSNPALTPALRCSALGKCFPPLTLKLTKGDRKECNYTQLSRKEPLFEVCHRPLIVDVSPDSLNEGLKVGLSASRLIGRSTAA